MDQKETLHRYLRHERQDLLDTLDGLSERDVRRPLTRTGTNLLGLVKHTASVQADYFGLVFDRPSGLALPWMDDDAEVNADMWARADESVADVVSLHHASAAHTDATIDALDLEASGRVPWWGDQGEVTLHRSWSTAASRRPATPATPTSSASSSTGTRAGAVTPSQTSRTSSGRPTGTGSRPSRTASVSASHRGDG